MQWKYNFLYQKPAQVKACDVNGEADSGEVEAWSRFDSGKLLEDEAWRMKVSFG
jgi:hypothetical protein